MEVFGTTAGSAAIVWLGVIAATGSCGGDTGEQASPVEEIG
eukprot:CAMPEP_0197898766 /NCGR_PEP_ID=MMETSP1439-20131203/44788_1 /TAXON_ID=66791 /ORGANISM="Gonyaulax spinifera, Strain CCMP409" /LENGTH=40 /DNA_ID= /DNA_START= /DNA_END= /DNA_ORIENTATION=